MKNWYVTQYYKIFSATYDKYFCMGLSGKNSLIVLLSFPDTGCNIWRLVNFKEMQLSEWISRSTVWIYFSFFLEVRSASFMYWYWMVYFVKENSLIITNFLRIKKLNNLFKIFVFWKLKIRFCLSHSWLLFLEYLSVSMKETRKLTFSLPL